MANQASRFNYSQAAFWGRYCRDCVHSLSEDGTRSYGFIKTDTIFDTDFSCLVCYCSVQEAFVKPFASCDRFDSGKEDE